ncbi:MAG: hypothetical protein ACT4N8_09970 [Sphingosinicella sp.]|uniref:hypothetical protein n=1 Tax=Sphingosinicella sp. TaxID=1917971 RepID=UPI004037AEB8
MTRLMLAMSLALSAASVPTRAQQPAVQQQFDAASAALEAGSWNDALTRFRALESRLGPLNERSLAIVRVRMALALLELGQIDESQRLIELALPSLSAEDPSLNGDRFEGLLTRARIAEAALDYPSAARDYREAIAVPLPDSDKLIAYRGLIQTQLFDVPEAAIRVADAAIVAVSSAPSRDRELRGQFHTLKGRALLNLRRFREAHQELMTALRLLGNLTLRVDRADLVARGDLALAALLTRREEDARRYLAYTGQGRFTRGYIPIGYLPLPRCGAEVAPDDVAVVEFSILDNGSVGHALPVYASRGSVALPFARFVSIWQFDRAVIQEISPLLRSVARVELRCTNQAQRLPHIEVINLRMRTHPDRIVRLPRLRAELSDAERAADPARLVEALLAIIGHAGVDEAERLSLLRRALEAATSGRLGGRLIAGLALQVALWEEGTLGVEAVEALLETPIIRTSPGAFATVRIVQASMLYAAGRNDHALTVLQATRDLPAVRGEAELDRMAGQLLSLIHAAADRQTASAAAEPGRCGLPPRRVGGIGASSDDFPREAARWGFEGWASIEPSIDASGRVRSLRTIVAYPPFVFGDAAQGVARSARFEASPVAEGVTCAAERIHVRFVMP